jgi:hypothetical protein
MKVEDVEDIENNGPETLSRTYNQIIDVTQKPFDDE